ncbi:molybdopterin cofactor-binding domain-containing protein [Flectobacillus longus]|uniref:molybdopterin cofactor-binding domain-containing protein n=1 Tax=Flectobacillus longus TaxID=2984207 RepID=UPI0024B783B2|nr:molybdopterin cofactor-binding domain-containing protein [Flectobacillus longus]MDI9878797.1 molybdopterin-dependent oxidoreductase [Flectobacillus longus]
MRTSTELNRRNFLKASGLSGAAFILGLSARASESSEQAIENLSLLEDSFELTPFVIIEKSGKITIMNSKPEIGQGTWQAIPMIIAEELELGLDQYEIKQTSGDKKFGGQTAGGSSSVRTSYATLRKTGAAAREMLVQAAAQTWSVPVDECYAERANVFHKPSGKKLAYSALVETASKLEVPKEPKLKDSKDFKLIGKQTQRQDIPLKVKGQATFGMDVEVPNMVYASVERCPVFGGKIKQIDDSQTLKVKGVLQVVRAERVLGKNRYEVVAVIASNYWAALKGRKALKVTWDYQGNDQFSSKQFEQQLRDLSKNEGVVDHNQGDFDKNYAEAPVKLEAFYETPMVSHSPMEPMNCIASWTGDKVEVWASSQGPDLLRNRVADAFAIPADNIKVNIFFNGGGFGRRLYQDFATEAVSIAKAVGKPVKVIWTREDDTTQGPFRPMTFSALKGALTADGKALAFEHKVISPSINATQNKNYDKTKSDNTMTEGISEQQYEIPHIKNYYVHAETHIPMAAWRAVTSTTLSFAHECFIDEMAYKANKDPFDFRLDMLQKDTDTKRVMLKLKEVSQWGKPLPKGWARGVAQWEFFAGLAAQVVEVSQKPSGGVKIEKVYAVIDLGTVVNPDTVKAQVEGAVTMAIGAATKDAITFEKGQVQQSNFHDNRMVRIEEMPIVEVHILAEGGPKIKGVGEPGLPPFAPALANAIFAATGKRIRRMPFDLDKV